MESYLLHIIIKFCHLCRSADKTKYPRVHNSQEQVNKATEEHTLSRSPAEPMKALPHAQDKVDTICNQVITKTPKSSPPPNSPGYVSVHPSHLGEVQPESKHPEITCEQNPEQVNITSPDVNSSTETHRKETKQPMATRNSGYVQAFLPSYSGMDILQLLPETSTNIKDSKEEILMPDDTRKSSSETESFEKNDRGYVDWSLSSVECMEQKESLPHKPSDDGDSPALETGREGGRGYLSLDDLNILSTTHLGLLPDENKFISDEDSTSEQNPNDANVKLSGGSVKGAPTEEQHAIGYSRVDVLSM